MDKRWRLVAMFAFGDIVVVGLNGTLAWLHRGAWSWALLVNCMGLAITLFSVRNTVQLVRALLQLRRIEKLLAAIKRANRRHEGER